MTVNPRLIWLTACILLLLGWVGWQHRPLRYGAEFSRLPAGSIVVTGDPQQGDSSGLRWTEKSYNLSSLATYTVRARILSTHAYYFDHEAELSPLDLAVGWGPMADPNILKQFDIWQEGRFYHWAPCKMVLSEDTIYRHCVNIHIIPGTPVIAEDLRALHEGENVELSGDLVEATAPNGWHWRSSLTQYSQGDGTCKLLLLRKVAYCDP